MAVSLYEGKNADDAPPEKLPKTSITPGIVQNNCDLLKQGKVLVRLPQLNQEIWARITAPGDHLMVSPTLMPDSDTAASMTMPCCDIHRTVS